MEKEKLIAIIQKNLSFDLLTVQWQRKLKENKNNKIDSSLFGHCYVASEAAWYLLGDKKSGYTPQIMSFIDKVQKITHWFLKNKEGDILDITAAQFEKIDYSLARGCGFLTNKPSKRAAKLIEKVKNSLKLENVNIEKYKKNKL